MQGMSNVPLLCRPLSPTSNLGLSYPSSYTNLGGMIDNGAHQYTTVQSGLAESAQIDHQDWVLRKLEGLMVAKANIDAELREFQDLYHKLEYARAQQSAHLSFTTTTTTPDVPSTTISPHSTGNISPHSFSQTANLSASQGETWNVPRHMPPPSTSQLSTVSYAQPATYPPPEYTVCNRAGKKIFRCECGHEASREGDMKRHRESLGHAKKKYICHCGKSYTRKDSLLRHATTWHMPESHVF